MTQPYALPLLPNVQAAADWLRQHATALQTDSRQLQAGQAFIAWPGAAHDARVHVEAALQRGATACLAEADGASAFAFAQPQATASNAGKVALYQGLREATALIAAEFYRHPSQAMDVIAVTGTNGKTSTAWWLAQVLARQHAAGAGMVGTLGVGRFAGQDAAITATGLTTPDPVALQHHLHTLLAQGVRTCVMEASPIGIEEHRLDGTRIGMALFTNFTQDHLDYHSSMAAYWQAKRKLFDWQGLRAAIINCDDAHGRQLAQELHQQQQHNNLDIWTLTCQPEQNHSARLQASNIRYGQDGLIFDLREQSAPSGQGRQEAQDAQTITVHSALIGHYNVANLLGVLACLRARGTPLAQAVALCDGLQPVPGRMECINQAGQPLVAVDYAHTPDAVAKALQALRPLAEQRGGRLWCVFGCGGNRDPLKRPLMAQAAESGADCIVLTSDNPRNEAPQTIMAQIAAGFSAGANVHSEPDRSRAIGYAIAQAAAADIVLVAGKGHEDYQEICGVRHPFSDQQHVRLALQARTDGAGCTAKKEPQP